MLNQWFLIQHLKEFIEVLVKECLRALSSWSATLQQNKQHKKEGEMKAFEFVLMNINTESKNWSIAEENIAFQRLFEVTTSSREAKICQAICICN